VRGAAFKSSHGLVHFDAHLANVLIGHCCRAYVPGLTHRRIDLHMYVMV
jgi:hypothetical protein